MAIVVAFLGTAEGEAALAAGLEQGRAHSVPVVVVPLDQAAASRAAELAAASGGEGGFSVAEPLQGRDAADAFLAEATALDASLIVIGIRKRSTVGKLILGSNAQRILLDASVPVLTVKAQRS